MIDSCIFNRDVTMCCGRVGVGGEGQSQQSQLDTSCNKTMLPYK